MHVHIRYTGFEPIQRHHPTPRDPLDCCWNAAKAMFCSTVGGRGGSGDTVDASMRIVDGPPALLGPIAVLAGEGEEGRESDMS